MFNLHAGVYVTYEAPSEYTQRCFNEYRLLPDETGKYAGLYRPLHLIGVDAAEPTVAFRREMEATFTPAGTT